LKKYITNNWMGQSTGFRA